ncbi:MULTISPECIES: HlyD family secretion protein [Brucella/Ochrobactrum group]|jgi:HlyD family secretion protein|uniref:HlyD family efflux transporter periplasmic adaptor subunit n=1 Tax=Brucella pseudintermedia TaxID=370111 RepID=A0ABY5UCG5_9HYPH|nr:MULTISPECIES: HlyD family efflux transporter periplasmic adaptor subunit [Brucella/Ochrobactrum group]KAB2685224.1 HlyD family efflux transporter periplasmic adaptor subunit [Brucella pseudintermedia]MCO7725542.1 HlyD family efflux transporter periplasmic adaptor subunit [Brucella intermedia]NKE76917.1 HlyD family efflux transporter periplasmic adaptor subunit [Ochrobactrum sp. MC-1LL]TWG98736.1 HlyD family secretion protein [Ochrobactrum sp. J50]UWL61031.1 HlyD family efflux transporter pe
MVFNQKQWILAGVLIALAVGGYYAWKTLNGNGLPEGIASGNGRIEAVEIDISTKSPGRIREILVDEGDFVQANDVLARMDTDQLESQLKQAEAQLRRAEIGIDTARSLVTQREAEHTAAEATVAQREAQLDAAQRRLARSQQLTQSRTVSQQVLDDDRATAQGAEAAVGAARAQLAATEAAIGAAKAQVIDAEASVEAARAAIASIQADINDATLRAPKPGRVQYRVAQPGEVLSAGGRVLNLVDVSDVYMTFFLPTAQAGRVAIGADARIVLDAAPQYVIPAKINFVADVAQFTPKTVETEEERQKLMFRVKAKIPQELLQKYIQQVKTGLPGMAYVKLDPNAEWPKHLAETVK